MASAGFTPVLQSAVGLGGGFTDLGQTFSYIWGLDSCRLVPDALAGKAGPSLQSSSRLTQSYCGALTISANKNKSSVPLVQLKLE